MNRTPLTATIIVLWSSPAFAGQVIFEPAEIVIDPNVQPNATVRINVRADDLLSWDWVTAVMGSDDLTLTAFDINGTIPGCWVDACGAAYGASYGLGKCLLRIRVAHGPSR
jgi:hypothetical protein